MPRGRSVRHARWWVLAAVLALAPALALPSASAHAVLQSADPSPNGHADANVTVVELVFTEDVEREYTKADVIDLQGESWAAGPIEFDGARHNVVRLPLKPLPSGIYAVSWQTLSVDTHTARGSFVFAAGDAQLKFALDTPAHDHAEHTRGDILREGFARAAFYAGLFFVVGMPLFAIVVLRGEPTRAMMRTAAAFGLVGAVAGFVSLRFFTARTGLPLAVALDTGAGALLAWRAGLLLAATACVLVAAVRRPSPRWAWGAVALGAASILATSLGSHAAAAREATALLVLADAAHLSMAAVWVGGIVAFLHVALERGSADLAKLVVRFSPLAVASVGVLLLTGTIASVAHIPCLRGEACAGSLLREPYVALILVKVGLLVPLAALGAYNKYRMGPAMERESAPPRTFRRALQAEAVLMALVLGAAGILAATPPPDVVVETETPSVLELQNATATSHVILQVRPNPVTVGIQQLRVLVHPVDGTLANGTTVQLKVWGPGEPEPETTIPMEKVAPDEWAIEDGLFTRAGVWNVMVLVQSDDFEKLKFTIDVVNLT